MISEKNKRINNPLRSAMFHYTVLSGRILCILAAVFSFNASAQETFVGEKLISVGHYQGRAVYEYRLEKGDTLWNGSFEFRDFSDREGAANTRSIEVQGQFKNDRPDGKWNFKLGSFEETDKKTMVDYQYVIAVNGIEKTMEFNLNEGEPEGSWLIRIDSVVNSEVSNTLFKSEFEYSAGVPQKSFRIESESDFMVGRLLRDAVAHDVWSLFDKDGIGEEETWTFNQGVLEKISRQWDDTSHSIALDFYSAPEMVTMNLDEDYLDIVELSIQEKHADFTFARGMAPLLEMDSKNYELALDFFRALGKPLEVEGFRVKVPHFPLSDSEKKNLETIRAQYQISDTLIQKVVDDAQLNILRLNDDETARYYRLEKEIRQEFLRPISRLLELDERELLSYVERPVVLDILWPDGLSTKAKAFQERIQGDSLLVAAAEFPDSSNPGLEELADLATALTDVATILKSKMEEKLSTNKREKAFLRQEKLLIDKAKEVERLIDSLATGAPKEVQNTIQSLVIFIQNELEVYSKMEETFDKVDYSQNLITCFDKIKGLAKAVRKLPEQKRDIEEAYKDQVWNPFTATVMDEEVKKRITKSYENQVIPYYLKKIENDLQCSEVQRIADDLALLQDRMLALRDEDTKRLERKLKRTKDPIEILELLGMNRFDD